MESVRKTVSTKRMPRRSMVIFLCFTSFEYRALVAAKAVPSWKAAHTAPNLRMILLTSVLLNPNILTSGSAVLGWGYV